MTICLRSTNLVIGFTFDISAFRNFRSLTHPIAKGLGLSMIKPRFSILILVVLQIVLSLQVVVIQKDLVLLLLVEPCSCKKMAR